LKLKKITIAFALLIANIANADLYNVNCSALNVRSNPFISNNKIFEIKKDTQVNVFSKTSKGWCKISFNKDEYVYCKYLSPVIKRENFKLNENIINSETDTVKESYLIKVIVKLVDEVNSLKNEVNLLKVKHEK
jgi:uncharacterized protein YgiM (DUF1202 family)